jgi:hypothetical protein
VAVAAMTASSFAFCFLRASFAALCSSVFYSIGREAALVSILCSQDARNPGVQQKSLEE